jgi:hypothetical protein
MNAPFDPSLLATEKFAVGQPVSRLGAWLSNATTLPPTPNTVKNIIGVYRTPLIQVSTKCLFTNTIPAGAYRGAGRPKATTTWNAWWRRPRPKWESIALSYGAAPHPSRADAVKGAIRNDL